jgi:micrococcal nuclease
MSKAAQLRKRKLPPAVIGVLVVAAVLMLLSRTGLLSTDRPQPVPTAATATHTIPRPMLELPSTTLRPGFRAVVRVVDGDTLLLDNRERVRLIGVDCPEIGRNEVDPESPGFHATMFVYELLKPDAQVRLEYDRERLDRYDRTLAYVFLSDGRMLNEVLLEYGWADIMTIPPNTRHARRFTEIRNQARGAGRGMWAE